MSQRFRPPWRTLALAAAAIGVAGAIPAELRPSLAMEPDAVLRGEVWRVWTAHLVHFTGYHLGWNVVPLIILGLMYEEAVGRRLWGLLLFGAPLVGLGLLILQPQTTVYCGLSGLLNTFWIGGAVLSARAERGRGNDSMARFYYACVLGGLAKIGIEAATGQPLFTRVDALGGAPVPLAHALGALAGLLWLGLRDWVRGVRDRARTFLGEKTGAGLPTSPRTLTLATTCRSGSLRRDLRPGR